MANLYSSTGNIFSCALVSDGFLMPSFKLDTLSVIVIGLVQIDYFLPRDHVRFPQNFNSATEKSLKKKTYNSGYSLVVTDPTTNPPI